MKSRLRQPRPWKHPLREMAVGAAFLSFEAPERVLNYARVRRSLGQWAGWLTWRREGARFRYLRVE